MTPKRLISQIQKFSDKKVTQSYFNPGEKQEIHIELKDREGTFVGAVDSVELNDDSGHIVIVVERRVTE